jgi:hypothetical protein
LEDLAESPLPRVSLAAVLALVGSLGVVAGSFLPWFDVPRAERDGFVLAREDVDRWGREAAAGGEDGTAVDRAREWLGGAPLDGWGWLAVSRFAVEHASAQGLEAREVRAWRVAIGAGWALPVAAGLLAILLLVGRLRPMTTGVLATCVLLALAVAALATLLLSGASAAARAAARDDPRVLGAGALVLAGSGAALFVAALLGGDRRTGLRAWAFAAGLAVLAVLATGIYVAG